MRRNCKFLHCADFHLGSPFRGLKRVFPEIAEILTTAVSGALDRLVRCALEHKVDFVLIAGDVFDSPEMPLRSRSDFIHALNQLEKAGIDVLVVAGNHDPLPWPESLKLPGNTTLFGSDAEAVAIRRDGEVIATVAGISGRSGGAASAGEFPVARLDALLRGAPGMRIGVFHADPGNDTQTAIGGALFEGSAADYWALGHIHKPELLRLNPPALYSGCIQGRAIDEPGERGCFLIENLPTGLTRTFLPLAKLRFETVEADLTGAESFEEAGELAALAAERLETPERTLFRIAFSGATALNRELRRESTEELRIFFARIFARRNRNWNVEGVTVGTRTPVSAGRITGLAAEVEAVRNDPAVKEKLEQARKELGSVFRDLPASDPDALTDEAADLLTAYLSGELEI